MVFLNGEKQTNYKPEFQVIRTYDLMYCSFADSVESLINTFGFRIPVKAYNFGLHTHNTVYQDKALASFSQIVSEDLPGYEYELEEANEGYFHVETLDTVKQEVSGRFRVQFTRTSKNGNGDLGLPETLRYQGVFNEKYEVY